MNKGNIINFEPKKRLLKKVDSYIESVELFLEEQDKSVPLLLKAFKDADDKLKHKIMFLLGNFAKQEAAWPLYQIMIDPDESEEIRHSASIQLSVIPLFSRSLNP